MQEWIVAMLVISILLIVRDMAKTIFSGRKMKTEETQIFTENHPQKEKAGGYFLWNALQEGLFKQRADTEDPGRRRGTGMWEMLPERALLGGECF